MTTTRVTREHVIDNVQVNIPFAMLGSGYLELFLAQRLNPEIGMDAAVLDNRDLSDAVRVAEAFHGAGRTITLHGPFMDLSHASQDPGIRALSRERLFQLVPMIPIFRPRTVVCHAGYDWRRYGYFHSEWLADSIAFWRELAGRVADAGSRLVLENVYETDPTEVLPLMDALAPEGPRWCLDIGHLHAFGNGRLGQWLDRLAPHIGQLHLHDNFLADDDHLALGGGDIDLMPVMDYLRSRESERPVLTLEPHRETDLELSLRFLAAHWPWPEPGLSG